MGRSKRKVRSALKGFELGRLTPTAPPVGLGGAVQLSMVDEMNLVATNTRPNTHASVPAFKKLSPQR